MTLLQAQNVAAAISNAGFDVQMTHDTVANTWKVRAQSASLNIAVAQAASLATSQGVAGALALIEYS